MKIFVIYLSNVLYDKNIDLVSLQSKSCKIDVLLWSNFSCATHDVRVGSCLVSCTVKIVNKCVAVDCSSQSSDQINLF